MYLHFTFFAVERQPELVAVVVKEQVAGIVGTDGFIALVYQALAQFVAQTVFCGHQRKVVFEFDPRLVGPSFYGSYAVSAIEYLSFGVDYVSAAVDGGLEVGYVVESKGGICRSVCVDALFLECLDCFASQFVQQ